MKPLLLVAALCGLLSLCGCSEPQSAIAGDWVVTIGGADHRLHLTEVGGVVTGTIDLDQKYVHCGKLNAKGVFAGGEIEIGCTSADPSETYSLSFDGKVSRDHMEGKVQIFYRTGLTDGIWVANRIPPKS